MKRIVVLLIAFALLFFCSFVVYAKESEKLPDEELSKELIEITPDFVKDLAEKIGVDEITPEKLLDVDWKELAGLAFDYAVDYLKEPLMSVGIVVTIIVICAILETFRGSKDTTMSEIFSLVTTISILIPLVTSAINSVKNVGTSISSFSEFITGYVPVFASSVIASGQTAGGGIYSSFMLVVCQIIASISANTLLPLMGIYLGISIISAISPSLKLNSISNAFKTCVTRALGLFLTIFVGMMSLQTLVAVGTDNLAVRAGKYLVGNFVPVVGSAISEVFLSVQGYMRLMKTCIGWFGVVATILLFLPILIQTIIWKFSLFLAQITSQVLNVPAATSLLEALGSVFTMLIAFILTFAMLLIVTTTLMLMSGMG